MEFKQYPCHTSAMTKERRTRAHDSETGLARRLMPAATPLDAGVDEEIEEPQKEKGLGNVAYEAMLDLLVSAELRQGDPIQERALAAQLGFSRTPLREALHRLEGERILERRSNNRLYVRQITLQEILEALHVRRLLEPEAASRAAGQIPPDELQALRERVEALLVHNEPENPEHQILDGDLHGVIGKYCDNDMLSSMINELRRKTRMFSLKRLDRRLGPVCREHLAMIDALERGDAGEASVRTAQHIDNIREAIITKLARW
jgi:DNA-binding GntR family transcriptional regulator